MSEFIEIKKGRRKLNVINLCISSVPLDQEISKSHESVFREPGDMAMLTIGLKVG